MKTLFLASAALVLAGSLPAQAQILGDLGGGLGGSIGGAIGGSGAGTLDSTIDSVRSTTRGDGSGSVETRSTRNADRRSGQVSTRNSAQGQGQGSLTQTLATPTRSVTAQGQGAGSAGGSADADAQLIGTDAVRGLAGTARGTASGVVGSARGTAGSLAGSAQGSASGAGNAMFSGAAGELAAAGSAAAQGAGSFDIQPGMKLYDLKGDKIGKVREVIADGHGRVQALLVKVDGETAILPAGNFTASGNALFSAMGEGQIKHEADRQEAAQEAQESQAEKPDRSGNR